jgi:hypothetical protein
VVGTFIFQCVLDVWFVSEIDICINRLHDNDDAIPYVDNFNTLTINKCNTLKQKLCQKSGLYLTSRDRVFLETNSYSASQDIPRLLCKPKFNHGIHKSPPLYPITTCSLRPFLILSCYLRLGIASFQIFLLKFYSHIHFSSPCAFYMLRLSYYSWFDCLHN